MKAAGYIRVSTQEQASSGLSIENQRIEIENYCKYKGYDLVGMYVDAGITARKELSKRQDFTRLMNDVKAHKVEHIVILRLDRFFRNVYDYHRMMNEYLIPNGCGWSAVKEEYDTTTTNGRLMINLRLSIAEQESDIDGERIRDVFANRIKDGFVVTGKTPLGLSIKDHRLVPNEDAQIVKDIFDIYNTTCSMRKTVSLIAAKHRYIKADHIADILHNPVYAGIKRGNPNYCEPIVSKDTFDTAQRNLKRNVRERKTHNEFIFVGLLKCARCGYAFTGSQCRGHIYYRCYDHASAGKCDNRLCIRESKIEQHLVQHAKNALQGELLRVRANTPPRTQKSNTAQIRAKIDRLLDAYVNGAITLDEYKAKKDDLESKIVPEPPQFDVKKAEAFLNSGFENVYEKMTVEQKRFLWRSVIDYITIDNGEVKDIIFLSPSY